jgi:Mg-chelatase subunit ChlD
MTAVRSDQLGPVCPRCGAALPPPVGPTGGETVCPSCGASVLDGVGSPAARLRRRLDPLMGWGLSLLLHAVLLASLTYVVMAVGYGQGVKEAEVGIIAESKSPTIEKGSASLAAAETVTPDVGSLTVTDATVPEIKDVALVGDISAPPSASSMQAIIGLSGGGDVKGGDWSGVTVGTGGGGGSGQSFEQLVKTLQHNGFEIVITFDSTGSMTGEIEAVKTRIASIGAALFKLVPKTRIGICTYRDKGDEYVAKGQALSGDLKSVESYLSGIRAGGGGDTPEAIHEALAWSVTQNDFHPKARKIILLFGDAPPHKEFLAECLATAKAFHAKGGIVSTVTVRRGAVRPGSGGDLRIPEFVEIAEAGGGEAFLINDREELMTQLMVLAFGAKHKDKVIEALKLTSP